MLFQGAQSGEQDRQHLYSHGSYALMGQDENIFNFKKKNKEKYNFRLWSSKEN